MKAKALKPFTGQYGRFRRGQDIDNVPDHYVQFLVKRGMAVPLAEAAKSASARPSTGGQTGEVKPSSSSEVVRAPAKRSATKTPKKRSAKPA